MSGAKSPGKRRLKKRLWLVAGFAVAAAGVIVIDYSAFPYGRTPGGRSFDRGENGLWLRYTWYFDEKSPAEVDRMCVRLVEHRIRYGYFHVRSMHKDGSLHFRYKDRAKKLINTVHKHAAGVRAIAWVYAGNEDGRGEVNLADSHVRKKMVSEAVWLVADCGFDGVQWDYEICSDGNESLLALLRETRDAVPAGKLISVATPMWLPWPVSRWGWSDEYFRRVAAECDQIAVMCYDSGFWLPRSYVWLVRQQAIHVTRAATRTNPNCRVLLGVPSYGSAGLSHNPRAENLAFALRGVREGMSDPAAAAKSFAGVAIFADYTTTAADWQTYNSLWLNK